MIGLGLNSAQLPGDRFSLPLIDVLTDAAKIVDAAIAGMGQLDILIHAVGERGRRGTDAMDSASFAALINADLTAAYGMAKAALPYLRRRIPDG